MTGERDRRDDRPTRRGVLDAADGMLTDDRATRRGVVRRTIAGGLAALGFTDAAAALDHRGTLDRLRGRYASRGAARRALAAHGTDVLATLDRRDDVAAPTVEELVDAGVDVAATYADGEPTAQVWATVERNGGDLTVVVQPEAGRQYAALRTGDDEVTVFDPDAEGVQPNCPTVLNCLGGDPCCPYWDIACCDYGCYTIGKYGISCCTAGSCPDDCSARCG